MYYERKDLKKMVNAHVTHDGYSLDDVEGDGDEELISDGHGDVTTLRVVRGRSSHAVAHVHADSQEQGLGYNIHHKSDGEDWNLG